VKRPWRAAVDLFLHRRPELVIRHFRAVAREGAVVFGDGPKMLHGIAQGQVHVARVEPAVLLVDSELLRLAAVSDLVPGHRGQFGMIGRPLREGVEGGASLFHFDGTGPTHGRIVRERMVEIRPAELGDELLEVLPLGRGEDIWPLVSEIALGSVTARTSASSASSTSSTARRMRASVRVSPRRT
jgi:hypothetical protein